MPVILPVVYRAAGEWGDFVWMAANPPKGWKMLLIFTDNVRAVVQNDRRAGAGSACVRTQCTYTPVPEGAPVPQSAGVVVAWDEWTGGFTFLGPPETALIDLSVERIRTLSTLYGYTHIVYPADPSDGHTLGSGVFASSIHDDVRQHVTERLHDIYTSTAPLRSLELIRKREVRFEHLLRAHASATRTAAEYNLTTTILADVLARLPRSKVDEAVARVSTTKRSKMLVDSAMTKVHRKMRANKIAKNKRAANGAAADGAEHDETPSNASA